MSLPLMGEPSLWNVPYVMFGFFLLIVSTPHGRAVPVEHETITSSMTNQISFNPSWESRPCGTPMRRKYGTFILAFQPLMGEPSLWNEVANYVYDPSHAGFNPSWESRPCGTETMMGMVTRTSSLFQPLMGEPSLWNPQPAMTQV